MTTQAYAELDRELEQYLSSLVEGLGRQERKTALGWYAAGLLLSGERKSIAPMAARLCADPAQADAFRQRLQQAVVIADWEDALLFRRLTQRLLPALGRVEALIGDDTGIERHGDHCVGTARQYSGTLGCVDRCQVIPSLHAAGPRGSFCLGARLYLPQSWTEAPARLRKAGVPEDIAFQTKWQILLDLVDRVRDLEPLAPLPFVGDAAFGDVSEFRRQLNDRQRPYLVAVMLTTAVWAPGTGPVPPQKKPGHRGRPQTQYTDGEHRPLSVAELALSQTPAALRTVRWKNGDGPRRSGRFGAVRVQPASGHCQGMAPEPEQWLLWQWSAGAEVPEHFWLSTLPEDTPLKRLVYLAKLRWRVERDYQEMKAEVGLDHYEGRTWRGLHHHWTLCAVAHGFLVLQRAQRRKMAKRRDGSAATRAIKKTALTEETVGRQTIPTAPLNSRRSARSLDSV